MMGQGGGAVGGSQGGGAVRGAGWGGTQRQKPQRLFL